MSSYHGSLCGLSERTPPPRRRLLCCSLPHEILINRPRSVLPSVLSIGGGPFFRKFKYDTKRERKSAFCSDSFQVAECVILNMSFKSIFVFHTVSHTHVPTTYPSKLLFLSLEPIRCVPGGVHIIHDSCTNYPRPSRLCKAPLQRFVEVQWTSARGENVEPSVFVRRSNLT